MAHFSNGFHRSLRLYPVLSLRVGKLILGVQEYGRTQTDGEIVHLLKWMRMASTLKFDLRDLCGRPPRLVHRVPLSRHLKETQAMAGITSTTSSPKYGP